MWLVFMLSPEINDGTKRKGQTLLAQGLIRVDEMLVGQFHTPEEAKKECMKLSVHTLRDHGHDTTVIGYGYRNYYAKKGAKLAWKMSLQQLVKVMRLRKAAKAAEQATQAA